MWTDIRFLMINKDITPGELPKDTKDILNFDNKEYKFLKNAILINCNKY